jgi:hypothetical protein
MRRGLTRAIELMFHVEVLGGEAHLLQCDLDGNGSAPVAVGKVARVNRVFVADGPNSGCHVHQRLQRVPADGFAEGSWSGSVLIFSAIENRFFSK